MSATAQTNGRHRAVQPPQRVGLSTVIDTSPLASGKILFAATGTTDPDAPYRLFVMNPDGTNRKEITLQPGHYFSPAIARIAGGGWRLAYSRLNELRIFSTVDAVEVRFTTNAIGDRPSFSPDASVVAYQAAPAATPMPDLNVWVAAADGSGVPRQVTSYAPPGAEWPYFVGSARLLLEAGGFTTPRRVVALDGSADVAVPLPGGMTVGHAAISPDAQEFLSPQKLTSYVIATGAVGTINDLKSNTTLLTQLAALGYRDVPSTTIPGQGGQGSFALSADWSRDGRRLVFDALVADVSSGAIRGVAIFTWDLVTNHLVLLFGPEPLTAGRTNNYNYSLGTPRWIP